MKKIVLIYIAILATIPAMAQKERKYIREGNKAFEKDRFQNAEVAYSKALKEPKLQHDAGFNIGDALYKQEKYPDALEQFSSLKEMANDAEKKGKLYHNIGNTLLKQKKYKESIEAFKQALREVPDDMETKYNLAYAQKMLQEQQNKQKKNQQQNKQNQQNKQDKQDQNQDQKQNNDQNKDKKKNQQQPNDNKNQNQQQQQQPQLSKQDAERLLKAIANDEKKIQEKVKEKQAKAKHKKTTKEW
jgi:tetratricopeptide (TPR) repeat protein